MKILAMRHGRTVLNERGVFNGQFDDELTDTGRAEAAAARTVLANLLEERGITLSTIYCSPLSRTWETCEIATAGLDVPIVLEPRLIERSLGTVDGRDIGMSGFNAKDFFNYHFSERLPGSYESWSDVFARVESFLGDLATRHTPDDSVLLVSHGGTLRALHYCFNPIPADGDISLPNIGNCEILEYTLTPDSSYFTNH